MKKILVTILMVLTVSVLTGCAAKNEITTYNADNSEQDMFGFGTQFVVVEEENLTNAIDVSSHWHYRYTVYDVDSKVMYYIFDGYNRATMSPVYNSDGTIKIYEEK